MCLYTHWTACKYYLAWCFHFFKLIQTNLDTINSVRDDFSLKPKPDQWRSFLFFLTWNYSNEVELIQPNTCKSWFGSGQTYYFFYMICGKSWWVEIIIMITQEKTKMENKLGKSKREKKATKRKGKISKRILFLIAIKCWWNGLFVAPYAL